MELLAWATMVELAGAPAWSPELIEAGLLEPQAERVAHRRPVGLTAQHFEHEVPEAWLFARTAAASFAIHREDGVMLRDWLQYSLEYRSLLANWQHLKHVN